MILVLIPLLYLLFFIVSAPLFVPECIGVISRSRALAKAVIPAQFIIIVGVCVDCVCQRLKRRPLNVEKNGLYGVIMCCTSWAEVIILPVYLVCPFVGAPTYARWVDSIPEWIVSVHVWGVSACVAAKVWGISAYLWGVSAYVWLCVPPG